MTEEKSPDFRFSMDEESPDTHLQEDAQNQRLTRLSRRVTILAILFPCLIGIVGYFGYADLKKTLNRQQTSGSQSVESLSKDLETLFDDLNARLTDIETNFNAQIEETGKNLEAVKFRVYKAENRIKKIAQADEKQQDAAEKDINQVNRQINQVDKEIDALDELFARRLTELVSIIENEKQELADLRSEISSLLADKVDRDNFNEMLEQDQIDTQKTITLLKTELGVLRTDLIKRLTVFEKKIETVEDRTRSLTERLDNLSKSTGNTSSKSPRMQPSPKPAPTTGIVEKDLS